MANPNLPAAPADGQHDFEGSARCNLCGAYAGSEESKAPCQGQWMESGKMRKWAAEEWAKERLRAQGQPRRISLMVTEKPAPRTVGNVLFGTEKIHLLQLECGHRISPIQAFYAMEAGVDFPTADADIACLDDTRLVFDLCERGVITVAGCGACERILSGARSGGRPMSEVELEDRPDLLKETTRG